MTTLSEFANDWKRRYLEGTATYDHVERLKNIGKLSEEEFRSILIAKKQRTGGYYGDN